MRGRRTWGATRAEFLAAMTFGGAAVASAASRAGATGGLDVETREVVHPMRVLLGPLGAMPRAVDAYRFSYEGRLYRGSYGILTTPAGENVVVNVLPLDAYLYGVVSREASPSWPRAALQAQAIASRTYAYLRRRPTMPYDVVATQSDQYYGGVAAESVEARDAVDSTSGRFIVYNGSPAHISYGSCCGGFTAQPRGAAREREPYLQAHPDGYCEGTPDFRWRRAFSGEEVAAAFSGAGLGGLTEARAVDVDASGRAASVYLRGTLGETQVDAALFRRALGTTQVRSTRFLGMTVAGGELVIDGAGFGHGLGMCQWGARNMSRDGARAAQILAFYYPGTRVSGAGDDGPAGADGVD